MFKIFVLGLLAFAFSNTGFAATFRISGQDGDNVAALYNSLSTEELKSSALEGTYIKSSPDFTCKRKATDSDGVVESQFDCTFDMEVTFYEFYLKKAFFKGGKAASIAKFIFTNNVAPISEDKTEEGYQTVSKDMGKFKVSKVHKEGSDETKDEFRLYYSLE